MNMNKIVFVLGALVLYINYDNYFRVDIEKIYREKSSLENKIEREIKLSQKSYTQEQLKIGIDSLMYSESLNYSQAMGKLQSHIVESAQDGCHVKKTQWAQTPSTKEKYQKLRINLSLECKADEIFKFNNHLKDGKKIYIIENFKISKDKRGSFLHLSMQVIAFRKKL